MSWLARLYETYEQAQQFSVDLPQEQQLMPVSHTPQNAHINIVIDGNGAFLRASVLEKTQLVLPATEQSAGRASGLAPHALADKIQYVAGDYEQFGGLKKAGFELYFEQLSGWCNSEFVLPAISAIHRYVGKRTVVADLLQHGVLHAENGILLTKWQSSAEAPLLFKVLPKEAGSLDQGSALVCWTVEMPGIAQSKTWLDPAIQQSWINFDSLNGGEPGLCLVKGEQTVLASNHPAKIRHSGDKAKLISANDSSGFTFRGKFTDSSQAAAVSFDVTQKAHNALRWLLARQSFRNGDQAYVSWAVSGKTIPNPFLDPWDLLNAETLPEKDHSLDLGQSYALNLKSHLKGTGKGELERNESICILGLDSATPGRMGIIYYRETIAEEFLSSLEKWYRDFAWPQRHKITLNSENKSKAVEKTIWSACAPAPYKIWDAVYGDVLKSTDSLKKNLTERLLPCIVEGRPLPVDIVTYAIKRATNRLAYKSDETWRWEQNLGIACALYKGFCKRTPHIKYQKDYAMALDESSTSRDYLYGRLLAVAENIESYALYKAGEKRNTTADRLMQRFADRPFSTWRNLELALKPYMHRLQNVSPGFLKLRQDLLDSIQSAFETTEFKSDKALSGEFLLGFHCQRLVLNSKKDAAETADAAE
ncbi:type I-C CRISPR-associated protein Cas8c/Csd1 [Alishewanella sp. HH-ZS]|uniref:type I-C CRISPR-associated protein Cas8c/Csd1 n=1 Tax=Alishewanella sp. HH-ZS TaxID=1856684 RepID=UPI000823662B|nr:type I-C CRISPR-associated protein Cas8c/Csd1 [Alishewanella sp. HH-ZS]OCW96240.1 type I-C CRISPR-associated protein Cas8c/Csd1 [Alishewanella sp. HH-ZS]